MSQARVSLLLLACSAAGTFTEKLAREKEIPSLSQQPAIQKTEKASLKVSLRLENNAPFDGTASIRLMPNEGYEIPGEPGENPADFSYSDVEPGKYIMEVSAPGYLTVRVSAEINAGEREKTLLVIMKPRPPSKRGTGAITEAAMSGPKAETSRSASGRDFWNPRELEEAIPRVDPQVVCPKEQVLRGVGQRMSEFVGTLEKFTAIEHLEHYSVSKAGEQTGPETRKFNYVVAVTQNREGTFLLEEFRNGSNDPEQFPGHVASIGVPAIDLIFHPLLAGDFDFRCEGLGQWKGRQAWQVHFVQRSDKPVRIRIYHVGNKEYPVLLEGRVWIDPASYQILRLESELAAPIPQIELKLEHLMIDYEAVKFRSTGQEVWLPQSAELYVDRQKKRYFRRHTFSNFELFNVDTAQKIQAPVGSYTITNLSDGEVSGELTVRPAEGTKGTAVSLRLSIPAHGKVTKVVGIGKDVNLAPETVESAAFVHNGQTGQVIVEALLVSGTNVEVTAQGKSP